MGYFKEKYPSEEGESKYLKSVDFEKGLEVEFIGEEKVKSNNPEYGANEADYLFKQNLLGKGETFRYCFIVEGMEKFYDSKSAVFFISMKNADPNVNEGLHIQKVGEKKDTKWLIRKL